MNGWHIERQAIPAEKLSYTAALHLQVRQTLGKAVIVTSQPEKTLATVRKQWMKLTKTLYSEQASTFNTSLKLALSSELEQMRDLQFGVLSRSHGRWLDVTFATPEEIRQLPTDCATIYICIAPEACKHFIGQLPAGCLAIIYTLQ
jgi:hypothetical protein